MHMCTYIHMSACQSEDPSMWWQGREDHTSALANGRVCAHLGVHVPILTCVKYAYTYIHVYVRMLSYIHT